MMRSVFLIILLACGLAINAQNANGAITGGDNFCDSFPTHPECSGYRKEPIFDNYWFCQYVDLPSMCKYKPDPQKQIQPLDSTYCCRTYNFKPPKNMTSSYYDTEFDRITKKGLMMPSRSPGELIVWTDKDHYKFGDRINVYGKFNFDRALKEQNQFVDVKFNNNLVISKLPVKPNGWFSGYFHMSDKRFYQTGISEISVLYAHIPTRNDPNQHTYASYKFTTGDISKPKESFSIIIAKNSFTKDISYKTKPEQDKEPSFIITRIRNPDGIVFPLPISGNLRDTVKDPDYFINGEYEIIMTAGNFVTKNTFDYKIEQKSKR